MKKPAKDLITDRKGNPNEMISDPFRRVNDFLKKRSLYFFLALLIVEVLTAYSLFDLKMTPGGDDSGYVLSAFDFVHDFHYPGQFAGALYPMFLSLFVKLGGVNLILLKSLSFILMFIFFIIFYISFKDKVPALVLFACILIISINSHLLFFSTHTYTEAFFLAIQACLFLVLNRFFLDKESKVRTSILSIVLLGFILFLLTLSKNIGLGCAVSVIAFLFLIKRWKDALSVTVCFGLIFSLFEVFKRIMWPETNLQINKQGLSLLHKDFYNPSQGYEDFSGIVNRIVGNSHHYLSVEFYNILGLRNDSSIIPALTILTYCLFLLTALILFKKNKVLLFSGIYAGIMSFITFIAIQTMWAQERLIIIYVPYFLLFFLGGLYYLLKNKNFSKMHFSFYVIVGILFFTAFKATTLVAKVKRMEFSANVNKNPYKGFNEGIANFIKMSKWASENTPKDKMILSRKPEISFAYTGRKFVGLYSVPNISADSMVRLIKQDTANTYYSVVFKDFFGKDQKNINSIFYDYRKNYTACVLGNGRNKTSGAQEGVEFLLFKFPKQSANDFIPKMNSVPISIVENIEELFKSYSNYSFKIYQPDVLVDWLKNNDVAYMIRANFAMTEKLNPGKREFTSTVQKFMHPITLKYNIFYEIQAIGNVENSATLIRVDFSNLK